MDRDGENQAEDEIHQLDTESHATFPTKEEHDNACLERGEIPPDETDDFRRGYQIIVLDAQRQIRLGNRDVPVVKNKETWNKYSTSKPENDAPPKDNPKSVPEPKWKERREDNPRSSDQGQTSFIMEVEIAKIKIYVPLTELLKFF